MKAVLPLLAVAGLLLSAGCSAGAGMSTRPPVPTRAGVPSAGVAVAHGRAAPRPPDATRVAAFRKWGLPLLPPPPVRPPVKPVRTRGPPVPVVTPLPTSQRVVFLTIDDGVQKDPGFSEMMQDLKVPFTMFLTDRFVRDDYRYFAPLKALGNGIENHTVTHPDLRSRTLVQQRAEICGQQTRLSRQYGTTPGLFRPPYGAWNETTRAAAKACGIRAIVNWTDNVQPAGTVYYGDGASSFKPGAIILAHFHGPQEMEGRTMTQMTADLLREVAAQGFTLARLEDYV
ncbi:MAG TPA: polysaccharide deacetylase family protein [Streptomyces sp.]